MVEWWLVRKTRRNSEKNLLQHYYDLQEPNLQFPWGWSHCENVGLNSLSYGRETGDNTRKLINKVVINNITQFLGKDLVIAFVLLLLKTEILISNVRIFEIKLYYLYELHNNIHWPPEPSRYLPYKCCLSVVSLIFWNIFIDSVVI
jgi:hypothetical protein